MRTQEKLREDMTLELAAVRDYKGGEAIKHVVKLLDSLIESYMHELVTVQTIERVQFKQGAVQQVIALRNCIVQEGAHMTPKV